jgi:hypothetical protein
MVIALDGGGRMREVEMQDVDVCGELATYANEAEEESRMLTSTRFADESSWEAGAAGEAGGQAGLVAFASSLSPHRRRLLAFLVLSCTGYLLVLGAMLLRYFHHGYVQRRGRPRGFGSFCLLLQDVLRNDVKGFGTGAIEIVVDKYQTFASYVLPSVRARIMQRGIGQRRETAA